MGPARTDYQLFVNQFWLDDQDFVVWYDRWCQRESVGNYLPVVFPAYPTAHERSNNEITDGGSNNETTDVCPHIVSDFSTDSFANTATDICTHRTTIT